MRIGLVVSGSLHSTTGGYMYDRQLVDHLRSHGDTVEVVELPWRGYARHLVDNVSPSLTRRLAGADFDVLLEDELSHPSLIGANRRLRARARCSIVTVVHLLRTSERSATPFRPLYASVERRYLTGVDGAVYNSEATRVATERLVGRPVPGLVAYPGADHLPEPVAPSRPGSEALRVLSVANVVPGKGLDVLLGALARLPAGSWRLTVVGSLAADGSYVARVRRQIRDAGLAVHVALVGHVPNAALPRHLAAHDVMVVPSSYEALGIAYLEAMRFGLPVVATTAGGAGEIVTHGCEGFLVAPGDVGGLTSYLRRWVDAGALLARMGAAARDAARRHPTWAQSFEPVRAFLRSLVESRQRATVT